MHQLELELLLAEEQRKQGEEEIQILSPATRLRESFVFIVLADLDVRGTPSSAFFGGIKWWWWFFAPRPVSAFHLLPSISYLVEPVGSVFLPLSPLLFLARCTRRSLPTLVQVILGP